MSDKNNVSTYIDYFRQLAVMHKDIRHDPASEDGDGEVSAKKFTKFSSDEIIDGLSRSIGFPALCIELYESTSESQIVYDVCLKPRGSFMVIDKPADKSFSAEQACYEKTEEIILSLLQRMWQDHYKPGVDRCETPFREIDLAKLNIIPVGPLFSGVFGWRCEFDFEFQKTVDISTAPEEGTFIE